MKNLFIAVSFVAGIAVGNAVGQLTTVWLGQLSFVNDRANEKAAVQKYEFGVRSDGVVVARTTAVK
jgi:hypothetical protein